MQYNQIIVGQSMDDATFIKYLMQDNVPMKIHIKGKTLQPYDLRFYFQNQGQKFGGLTKTVSFGNFFKSHTDIESIAITSGRSEKRKSSITIFFDSNAPQIKEVSISVSTIEVDGVSSITIDKKDRLLLADKFVQATLEAGYDFPMPSKLGFGISAECRIIPIEGKDHFILQVDKIEKSDPKDRKSGGSKYSYAPSYISNKKEPETTILDLIRNATPKAEYFLMNVTPKMAEDMLIWNTQNRQLRLENIFKYALDMKNDKWIFNNESTLGFSIEHKLVDGQSRLLALIKAGVTLPFIIFTGLPPEALPVLNSGRNRSQGDTLSLKNIPEPNKNAPAVSMIIYMQKYGKPQQNSKKDPSVSNQEIDEWLSVEANHKRFNELLVQLDEVWRNTGEKIIKRHIWLAMYFIIGKIRATDAEEFMTRLANGADIGKVENSPIYYLRTLLQNWGRLKAQGTGPKTRTFQQVIAIITAWNHYLEKDPKKGGPLQIKSLDVDYNSLELPKISRK